MSGSSGAPQEVATPAPAERSAPGTGSRQRRPAEPWVLFVLVHATVWAVAPLAGFTDVTEVYRAWFRSWATGAPLPGIGTDWVYPVLALVPILLACAAGSGTLLAWLVLVTALDAVAFAVVLRRGVPAARWWAVLLLALGPVALGRIDAIAAPVAIVGIVLLLERPRVAAAVLTAAAWIKVWPAAVLLGGGIALPGRRRIVVGAAAACVVLVAADAALGGAAHLLSFVQAQTGRGLEFESPIATPWLWLRAAGLGHVRSHVDATLLDVQLDGDGTAAVAGASTALMAALLAIVCLVAILRARAGADPRQLLARTSLALVLVLLTADKVGSPQYVTWLAAPVVLGLLVDPVRLRRTAAAVIAVALLTQLAAYAAVLSLDAGVLVTLTARNAGLAGLLVSAIAALVRTPAPVRGRAVDPVS